MKPLLTAMAPCVAMCASAHNIDIGTSSPNSNATRDITATDKGLLIPHMVLIQRKSIPTTAGFPLHIISTKSSWYIDGSAWAGVAGK